MFKASRYALPLHWRLTLFYTLILVLALWLFSAFLLNRTEQEGYTSIDRELQTRALSVRLGKMLFMQATPPVETIPALNGLGDEAIAIEVLRYEHSSFTLLATTATVSEQDILNTGIQAQAPPPVPWDAASASLVVQGKGEHCNQREMGALCRYSTITFHSERIRVFTYKSPDSLHIIQTAQSYRLLERRLDELRRMYLLQGLFLVGLALLGNSLIGRGLLGTVRRITNSARTISETRDFGKRLPERPGLVRDEFTTLTETFNRMLDALERLYREQQRFIADASHELRAPITAIRCNLDLLAKARDLPPEEQQEALADVQAEAERMSRLVNDLLWLARSDSLAAPPQHRQVKLDSLLLDVFRQYHRVKESNRPRLRLQETEPVCVLGDADQLKQALVALIDNALKYTPPEGIVSLSLTVQGQQALLRVSDTGPGIAAHDIPLLFERFYRTAEARAHRDGSGLGLAIVQRIVQDHKGTVTVASEWGKGSTFTIQVPLTTP
ncbi:signal transduction histidine kinase [Thermosporothrix hazakensis]|uniref:histidine kinase n=2 Tax=Thermosporothrix TaxID=768650 RepID=A0A326UDI0_THEHA|nr:ATP-binding protein [Thermosporothrix hazakensis]PZW35891.1 signal transduction histidine kinase [Thermosporothrix hazakensis]BBH88357.1 two-component sensor histidine kinase [Thermosporothrix sp. COM3]GCE46544.1 two-component sensor histidine kinase [Thermosporothrix hazakensis]